MRRNSEAEQFNRLMQEEEEKRRQKRVGGLSSEELEKALLEERREQAAKNEDEDDDDEEEDDDNEEESEDDGSENTPGTPEVVRRGNNDGEPRQNKQEQNQGNQGQMSEAKKQRLARAEKFETERNGRTQRLENLVRPVVSRAARVAAEQGSPEVFVGNFDQDNQRAVVLVKGSNGGYKSLGSVIGGDYEEDVRLVFGSKITANLEKKEVEIPRGLTKRDLPFVVREILRVAYLDRQESFTGTDLMGPKGRKKEVSYDDYRESKESILLCKERKKRKSYLDKLTRIRGNWKTRPFITMRDEYKKAENDYLDAKQKSEKLLDDLLSEAAGRFSSETNTGLFDGCGGSAGFEAEKKKRLKAEQNEFVYKFDKKGIGALTGFYTPDMDKARQLNNWDYVPLLSLGRRLWYDRDPFDQLRRAKRVLWDNSETGANARFRHKILHDFEDKEGLARTWQRIRWFTGEDAPLALVGTTAAAIGGAVVTGLALPYLLFGRVNEALDDVVESSTDSLFGAIGWKWLQTKGSWKTKREKRKKWIEDRVDSLLKIRPK